ncbi:hypothetical protein CR513_00449, partial [Mucuna pruriens]
MGHFVDKCYNNKGKQKKEVEAQRYKVIVMIRIQIMYSNHMTRNKGWFVNIDEKVKRMMKFADNSTVTTKGMGKVLIHRRDGQ